MPASRGSEQPRSAPSKAWPCSKNFAACVMTTPKLHPDLSAFLSCLTRHRVRFVVIGAHALATLGRPRYTEDLDVLVEPTAANAKRLATAFRAFGYGELADRAPVHFAEQERMATLGLPPVAIDVLTSTTGLTFAEAWRGRNVLDIELLREAGLLDAPAHGVAKRKSSRATPTRPAPKARKPPTPKTETKCRKR